jgi:hypothetical protein
MNKIKNLSETAFLKLFFGFVSLAFLVAAVFMPDRGTMLSGLWNILTGTCKISTNYFALGGYAATYLNMGLVGLVCTALCCLPGSKPNNVTTLGVLLTIGFGSWGINPLNMIPTVLGVLLYTKLLFLGKEIHYVAGLLALNGIILYVPQFLPGANKESGAMTRIDGLILGLGGALGVLPGISCLGAGVSIGSVRGMDMKKVLNLALLMNIPVNLGLLVFDVMELAGGSMHLSFGSIFGALLAAAAAFGGIVLGIRLLQKIVQNLGYSVFGFYSWTVALLMFFLYLAAV